MKFQLFLNLMLIYIKKYLGDQFNLCFKVLPGMMLLLLPLNSVAVEPVFTEQDSALISLVNLLNTRISTRDQSQSSDESSAVVTILDGRSLVLMGVSRVAEALTLVAGFEMPQTALRSEAPVLRGVGGLSSRFSGKIRYMINGSPVNNVIYADNSGFLQLPIEQVERIEVLRGPGSALYGEYAALGVINVITRKTQENAYLRAGSDDSYAAGVIQTIGFAEDISASINLAVQQTDGATINSGKDAMYAVGQGAVSNAEGQPNLARKLASGFFDVQGDDWHVGFNFMDEMHGDGFGAGESLSVPQKYAIQDTQYALEFGAESKLVDWDLEYQLSAKRYTRDINNLMVLPAGAFGLYADGLLGRSSETEQRYEAAIRLSRKWSESHRLLASLEWFRSEALDISIAGNADFSTIIPGLGLPAPLTEMVAQPYGYEGKHRENLSAYVSDQVQLTPQTRLTAGLRFDHYSDVESQSSPYLGVQYRLNQQQLIKTRLSRGFRPPTFIEKYIQLYGEAGNPDLKAETIDTFELAHIYRDSGYLLQTTFYLSQIDHTIVLDDSFRYTNAGGMTAKGIEFDFEYPIQRGMKLFGNLALQDAQNDDQKSQVVGSSNILLNMNFQYQPRAKYAHVLRYRYVGTRYRAADDPRDDLAGYSRFDFSTTVYDAFHAGLKIQFSIQNLLDEDYQQPARAFSYAEDFPQPGRGFWLKVAQDFN